MTSLQLLDGFRYYPYNQFSLSVDPLLEIEDSKCYRQRFIVAPDASVVNVPALGAYDTQLVVAPGSYLYRITTSGAAATYKMQLVDTGSGIRFFGSPKLVSPLSAAVANLGRNEGYLQYRRLCVSGKLNLTLHNFSATPATGFVLFWFCEPITPGVS